MNQSEMVEKAANKVNGLRELARLINWDASNLVKVKNKTRPMPPYRAAQIAEILGMDPRAAYIEALKEVAIDPGERSLLGELLRALKGGAITLTVALALYMATFIAPQSTNASKQASANGQHIHYYQCET